MVGAIIAASLYGYFTEVNSLFFLIPLSVLICIAAVLGDLVESQLKRALEVKDSGNIIPGHGGFLDRFDSVYMAAPFVVVYIILFDALV